MICVALVASKDAIGHCPVGLCFVEPSADVTAMLSAASCIRSGPSCMATRWQQRCEGTPLFPDHIRDKLLHALSPPATYEHFPEPWWKTITLFHYSGHFVLVSPVSISSSSPSLRSVQGHNVDATLRLEPYLVLDFE